MTETMTETMTAKAGYAWLRARGFVEREGYTGLWLGETYYVRHDDRGWRTISIDGFYASPDAVLRVLHGKLTTVAPAAAAKLLRVLDTTP